MRHVPLMQDFIKGLGRPFIATALRRVSEQFQAGAVQWYSECGISAPVKTASAVLLLDSEGPLSITEMAGRLRQSHPTTIDWTRSLEREGLVQLAADPADRRRSIVSLTDAGREQAKRIWAAQDIFREAYAKLCEEIGADIYPVILRLEEACERQTMLGRLREAERTSSREQAGR